MSQVITVFNDCETPLNSMVVAIVDFLESRGLDCGEYLSDKTKMFSEYDDKTGHFYFSKSFPYSFVVDCYNVTTHSLSGSSTFSVDDKPCVRYFSTRLAKDKPTDYANVKVAKFDTSRRAHYELLLSFDKLFSLGETQQRRRKEYEFARGYSLASPSMRTYPTPHLSRAMFVTPSTDKRSELYERLTLVNEIELENRKALKSVTHNKLLIENNISELSNSSESRERRSYDLIPRRIGLDINIKMSEYHNFLDANDTIFERLRIHNHKLELLSKEELNLNETLNDLEREKLQILEKLRKV